MSVPASWNDRGTAVVPNRLERLERKGFAEPIFPMKTASFQWNARKERTERSDVPFHPLTGGMGGGTTARGELDMEAEEPSSIHSAHVYAHASQGAARWL